MARYQVILAYDGTEFFGFQRQAQGKKSRTVQAEIESALRRIGWQATRILAAGRTDTGVHAAGQVVAFDLDWPHGVQALVAALNANLPHDVAVQAAFERRADFHPRYDALSRSYRYRIFCKPIRDPLRERYAWRVWPAPELERLQASAKELVGSHDFAAFGSPPRTGGSTVRQVFEAGWQAQADELTFEIAANAFLFRMVRHLVGLQVSIGQRALELVVLNQCFQSRSRELAKILAPAQGLSLVQVDYPEELTEGPGNERRQREIRNMASAQAASKSGDEERG
jgi:tRNA pseudouridine38-40 synthase